MPRLDQMDGARMNANSEYATWIPYEHLLLKQQTVVNRLCVFWSPPSESMHQRDANLHRIRMIQDWWCSVDTDGNILDWIPNITDNRHIVTILRFVSKPDMMLPQDGPDHHYREHSDALAYDPLVPTHAKECNFGPELRLRDHLRTVRTRILMAHERPLD